MSHSKRAHGRLASRPALLIFATLVLVAAHAAPLYYLRAHKVLSAGVVAGVVGLVLLKHLGVLGPVFAMVRTRLRRSQK